jgi:hypothetical protein
MKRPSTWYSGTRPGVGSLSRTGLSPTLAGLSRPLLLANRFVTPCGNRSSHWTALQHRDCNGCDLSRSHGLGSSAFARHYSRNILCSSRYLDVSVPSVSSTRSMYSTVRPWDITPGGFPHSDISGSTLARNSPKHFAACHVLRRLLAPRHPPHALSSLTYIVHAASTVLACARSGRVGISSTKSMLPLFDW